MSSPSTVRPRVRVAAAQYPLDAVVSFEAWSQKCARWVADGAATGAKLLVFPEYGAIELAATRGPLVAADLAVTLAAVADLQGAAAQVWSRLAHEHGVFILAPSGPEHTAQNGFVNAARLYGPNGGVGVQEKLILTPFERDWGLAAGRGQTVFDTALGRIGIAICYDAEFPLLVRALAEAGAEIILIPACTERMSGWQRVRTAAQARALENQIATVMSPTVGDATWSAAVDHNSGSAAILVPSEAALSMTGVLAEGVLGEPGWIRAEIDLEALAQVREAGEVRNSADWSAQSGALPLGTGVTVERLD